MRLNLQARASSSTFVNMSAFQKKSDDWAADDTDEDEEVVANEEDEDDESTSEEEEEIEQQQIRQTRAPLVSSEPVESKKKEIPLSKKERKELRQKELEDLESLLKEFSVESGDAGSTSGAVSSDSSVLPTDGACPSQAGDEDAKKKKAKKRKPKGSGAVAEETIGKNESSTAEAVSNESAGILSPEAAAEALRKKVLAKAKAARGSDAARAAIAAALKDSSGESKKKKSDKKKQGREQYDR